MTNQFGLVVTCEQKGEGVYTVRFMPGDFLSFFWFVGGVGTGANSRTEHNGFAFRRFGFATSVEPTRRRGRDGTPVARRHYSAP